MTPFTRLTAIAAPMPRDNVDTDAIIPSREMRSVSREGLADGLFAGWRYREVGSRDPEPGFILNQATYRDAQILVAGRNFGCGSSREHAVWALAEYGFRAIVACSFNPIFRGNCIANGVLPAMVAEEHAAEMCTFLSDPSSPILTVDLVARAITSADGREWPFAIDPHEREALLQGLDPIGMTLLHAEQIREFRARDAARRPWIYL